MDFGAHGEKLWRESKVQRVRCKILRYRAGSCIKWEPMKWGWGIWQQHANCWSRQLRSAHNWGIRSARHIRSTICKSLPRLSRLQLVLQIECPAQSADS